MKIFEDSGNNKPKKIVWTLAINHEFKPVGYIKRTGTANGEDS